MHVALRGNSPSTITAGIMLLTRARQLGYSLHVEIVGDEGDLSRVPGPAVVYAPVLASCGVGREHGSGATVVVPGSPGDPVMVSVAPHGDGDWFLVDRTGQGAHPATQAFVALSRDEREPARQLGRDVRRAMEALGMAPDTAVLDVLFGAPVPPLLRLALALRAGRALSGGRGEPITRYLAGSLEDTDDPIDDDLSPAVAATQVEAGEHRWLLDRLSTTVRDPVEAWAQGAVALAKEDGGRDLALLKSLLEVAGHLAQLPHHSILPPLGAAEDSVAVGLKSALAAKGEGDANRQLSQVYRFLGGRYTDADPHALLVSDTPAPTDGDAAAIWRWFSTEARIGRKRADALWEDIFDPAQ